MCSLERVPVRRPAAEFNVLIIRSNHLIMLTNKASTNTFEPSLHVICKRLVPCHHVFDEIKVLRSRPWGVTPQGSQNQFLYIYYMFQLFSIAWFAYQCLFLNHHMFRLEDFQCWKVVLWRGFDSSLFRASCMIRQLQLWHGSMSISGTWGQHSLLIAAW
jgi:hypothetical protein